MKNNFFYKLYVFDKRLFFFIIIFFGFTLFCNIMGDEVAPFFIWAMYSEKENPANKYKIYKIEVNDSVLVDYTSGYSSNSRFFLSSPLSFYDQVQQNNYTDPTLSFLKRKLGSKYNIIKPLAERINNGMKEQMMFTPWYKRYLEQTIGKPIHSLKVEAGLGHFTADHRVLIDSSYLLTEWQQH